MAIAPSRNAARMARVTLVTFMAEAMSVPTATDADKSTDSYLVQIEDNAR
jgi:hypothetical protein